MKRLILYSLLVLSCLSFQNRSHLRWVISQGCSLQVAGSTNINRFACDIINYSTPDTISISKNNNQVLLSGNIKLSVQNFNCHNPIMTADLRKTLKASQFPKLMIYFISMNKYPEHSMDITKGSVVIVLAGVSKSFEVDYKVVSAGKNNLNLEGSRKINFSDFNITPPRKLGGMIQTNNELSVVFNLNLKVLE